ncbi:hypothetical protein [Paraburkholderia sediminicola]|uniref:hypothetical protein n=1 Tax=Paraburkholderia sediminicola TaxID=458836 RepID=UPI0038BBDC3C
MGILLLIALTVVCFLVWESRKSRSNKLAFFEQMRWLNQSHRTSFPVDESGIDLILSDGTLDGSIVFDPTTRKLCLVARKQQQAEVLDFSYIRQWQLKWTEKSANGRLSYENVHFHFSTNDIKRPLIRIGDRNKTHADTWNSRLSILLA